MMILDSIVNLDWIWISFFQKLVGLLPIEVLRQNKLMWEMCSLQMENGPSFASHLLEYECECILQFTPTTYGDECCIYFVRR